MFRPANSLLLISGFSISTFRAMEGGTCFCWCGRRENRKRPLAKLTNKEDNITVTMKVPGLEKSDINTQVQGDTLTISGNQKNVIEKKQGDKVVANEQITRHFQSKFTLPGQVKADEMKVDYNHDMLTITLPKA